VLVYKWLLQWDIFLLGALFIEILLRGMFWVLPGLISFIHRRNVLVSDKGLSKVKLADVGLSRLLSKSDYYRKSSKSKVPFRWMAPESILEKVWTTSADVWSFGVLCWEIFSLAESPYGNATPDQIIVMVVHAEGRLLRPALCSHHLFGVARIPILLLTLLRYDVILSCWSLDPETRPSFSQLESRLQQFCGGETSL
jgi:serine/threonine protein kinase